VAAAHNTRVIYSPLALPFFLFLLVLAVFLFVVELEVLAYAYRKIGVRPRYVFTLLLLSLLGAHVNVPLYEVPVQHTLPPHAVSMFGWTYVVPGSVERGVTVVAINVGGAVIPILLSLYLFFRSRMYVRMLLGTAIVAVLMHSWARIEPGLGIAVPIFLPPLIAAGVGLVLAFRRAPPLAYVAGSMGTLIGADLLNLDNVAQLGSPIVSIGGAGTFDGVFLTGIIAGLLA
jgi:uncharacterized membrane protein